MSEQPRIRFTPELRDDLRVEYERALSADLESFEFCGEMVLTNYAQYLLEYLDMKLPPTEPTHLPVVPVNRPEDRAALPPELALLANRPLPPELDVSGAPKLERLRALCNWAAGRLLDAGDVQGHEHMLRKLEEL
jgi:hypothetical protein